MGLTGLSKPTVKKGIKEGLERGTILRKECAASFVYSLAVGNMNPPSPDSGDDISLMEETEEAEAPAPEPDKSERHEDGDGGKDFYQGNDFAGQESDRVGARFLPPTWQKIDHVGGKNLAPHNEEIKETNSNTHTNKAAPAAPAVGVVCALSKFSPEDCFKFAEHLHKTGQGINNPGGFAVKVRRTGECDEQIARFLAMGQESAVTESFDIAAMLQEGQAGRHKLYSLLNRLYDGCDPGSDLAGKIALLRGDVFSRASTELLERYSVIGQAVDAQVLFRAVNQ